MKKEIVLISVFLVLILTISFASSALKSTIKCDYDEEFDSDEDFIMSDGANCPKGYQYDCDDSNKDIFKDCKTSIWSRMIAWLKGTSERQTNVITGNVISNMIPDAKSAKNHIDRVMKGNAPSQVDEVVDQNTEDCTPITICMEDFKEVFCPLSYDECDYTYDGCRVIECADAFCENRNIDEYYAYEDEEYHEEYSYEYSDDDKEGCTEEYNNCFDGDEEVICKGSFGACSRSFDSCTCGTEDDTSYESDQLQPDIDSHNTIECDTGVYICTRQTITMSGDIADSTVTCKESFSRCSMTYGECTCGESTLTDFPTQYIGNTGMDYHVDNAQNYWCDYKGRDIPCYMLPENCNKKRNTCKKASGQWVTCEGTFDFCESRYEECLCGVEQMNSGFMVTSAD